MKRLLPILTLALLGAAVTAFAADEATPTVATSSSNYYYDYYLNPPNTAPVRNNYNGNENFNYSDTFTYGTRDNAGISIDNPNVFTVARESNWGSSIPGYNKDNFYRVEFANYVGEGEPGTSNYTVSKSSNSNTGKVALYLTDYVSEVVPQSNGPYNSSSNALFNMGIVEYGYRELTANGDGTYTAGETFSNEILVEDPNGEIVVGDKNYKLSDKVTPIDSIDYYGDGRTKTRYKYELGTFDPDKIIEVYMKDADGREVYSFSSYEGVDENGENVFTPFDKTDPEVNGDPNGGFGDGGYRMPARETDKMLSQYYFVQELPNVDGTKRVNSDYQEASLEEFDKNKNIISAAQKAMPLSELIPMGNLASLGAGTAVQFGFYGVAVGSPLPGGLQIAHEKDRLR